MNDSWVKETLDLIEELQQQKNKLEAHVEFTILEIEELQTQILGAQALIPLYRSKHNISAMPTQDIQLGYFSNKTYPEMLTEIATKSGGYFKVLDATEIMLQAGVSKDKRQIQANIYAVLRRMKDRFVKVKRGEYRYTNGSQKLESKVSETKVARSKSGVQAAIKNLKDNNPQMTKKEVLNHLLEIGFDFKGKKPVSAVNIVWAKLGYSKEGKQQKYF